MSEQALHRTVCWDIENANKGFQLVLVGDVHYDTDLFSRKTWDRFLERAKWLVKHGNPHFVWMGDYLDYCNTHDRAALSTAALTFSTKMQLEKIGKTALAKFISEIEFTRGRNVGFLKGNHGFTFRNGLDDSQALAAHFDTHYLGVSGYILIDVKQGWPGKSKMSQGPCRLLKVYVRHGTGGTSTAEGAMRKLELMKKAFRADWYFMGHVHQRAVAGDSVIDGHRANGKAWETAVVLYKGLTGSFMRAYVDGEDSYVADRGFSPADLGWVEIHGKLVQERKGKARKWGLHTEARFNAVSEEEQP